MVIDSINGESSQLSLSLETPNSCLSMTLTNAGVVFVQADRMGELVDPHPDTIPLKPTSLAEAQMFVRWLTLGLAHMESLVKKDWELSLAALKQAAPGPHHNTPQSSGWKISV